MYVSVAWCHRQKAKTQPIPWLKSQDGVLCVKGNESQQAVYQEIERGSLFAQRPLKELLSDALRVTMQQKLSRMYRSLSSKAIWECGPRSLWTDIMQECRKARRKCTCSSPERTSSIRALPTALGVAQSPNLLAALHRTGQQA